MKPKLLLHVCCAPCASHLVKDLSNCYNVTLAFYGPNIHPEEEYEKRLDSAKNLAGILKVDLIELENDIDLWFEKTTPYRLENEAEGGKRCNECYKIRLDTIAQYAKENDYKIFATTLTASPYKPAYIINPIGLGIAKRFNIGFLDEDFKKKDGFKKSCDLSKKYGLYRQNYCGCIYSKKSVACNNE